MSYDGSKIPEDTPWWWAVFCLIILPGLFIYLLTR